MPTVLGTVADRRKAVRKLAGNLDTNDISDADLDEIIERNDNWVMTETKKFDWVITDKKWFSVLNASNLMSSAEVLDGIPSDLAAKKAGDQRIAARDIVKAINRKDDDIQNNTSSTISSDGPNIVDELDSVNYIPEPSEVY